MKNHHTSHRSLSTEVNVTEKQQINPLFQADEDLSIPGNDDTDKPLSNVDNEELDEEAVEYVEQIVRDIEVEQEQIRVITDLDTFLEEEDDPDVEQLEPPKSAVHKNWEYASRKTEPPLLKKEPEKDRSFRGQDLVVGNSPHGKKLQPDYENIKYKQREESRNFPGADDQMLRELQHMSMEDVQIDSVG